MDMILGFLIFAAGYMVGTFGAVLSLVALERAEAYFDEKRGE